MIKPISDAELTIRHKIEESEEHGRMKISQAHRCCLAAIEEANRSFPLPTIEELTKDPLQVKRVDPTFGDLDNVDHIGKLLVSMGFGPGFR